MPRILVPARYRPWTAVLVLLASTLTPACTPQQPLEPAVPSTPFAELEGRFPAAHLAEGRMAYLRICSTCHQADGRGTGNAIPPLLGHVPKLANLPQGKAYLARVGLYGLTGKIEVRGRQFYNLMPAQGTILGDLQLAGAINYALTQWGNDAAVGADQLLTPQDVFEQRQTRRTAADNLLLRQKMLAAAPKPATTPAAAATD